MTLFIGLDAHSGSCTFVTLNDAGNMASQVHVPTTESFLLRYVRSIKRPRKLLVEESSISQWVYVLLRDEVDELIVSHNVSLGRRRGPKGDFRDASDLANKLRCHHLMPASERARHLVAVHHEESALWALRTLVHGYYDATKSLTQTKNRYKALFRANAIEASGSTIYKDESRLAELPTTEQFVARQLFDQIGYLEKAKEHYEPEFDKFAKKNPEIHRLCTIPGIGIIRASTIAAFICSPERFRNKHKLWAYAMLARYENESDGANYGSRAIQARRELKGVFDGAAISALRGSSALKKHYDRLRTRGTAHREAKKDVARKISAISLTILKRGGKYDDRYEEKKERSTLKKTI